MKLQEVAQQVQMTKRAIKYYEEKGLLHVEKDENGYRRYTEEHIATDSGLSKAGDGAVRHSTYFA